MAYLQTVFPPAEAERFSETAGQFFELEDREMAGRRVRVYKHAPATLLDVLQASRAHGAADFIVYEGRRLSFDRFFAEADALAATPGLLCRPAEVEADQATLASLAAWWMTRAPLVPAVNASVWRLSMVRSGAVGAPAGVRSVSRLLVSFGSLPPDFTAIGVLT